MFYGPKQLRYGSTLKLTCLRINQILVSYYNDEKQLLERFFLDIRVEDPNMDVVLSMIQWNLINKNYHH